MRAALRRDHVGDPGVHPRPADETAAPAAGQNLPQRLAFQFFGIHPSAKQVDTLHVSTALTLE